MTELTDLDRRIIGGNKRITIPMESRELMSEVLDQLRRLCNDINDAVTLPNLTDRQVLMMCNTAVEVYQTKLAGYCAARGFRIREGRPTNAERLRGAGNIRRVK